jgi:hypothetical protein
MGKDKDAIHSLFYADNPFRRKPSSEEESPAPAAPLRKYPNPDAGPAESASKKKREEAGEGQPRRKRRQLPAATGLRAAPPRNSSRPLEQRGKHQTMPLPPPQQTQGRRRTRSTTRASCSGRSSWGTCRCGQSARRSPRSSRRSAKSSLSGSDPCR